MLFGQKVHPLNFEYGDSLTVAEDHARLDGRHFTAMVRCETIADFGLRLRFDNGNVADKRQYSDAVLPQYREGRPVPPRRGFNALFRSELGSVELGASWLRIALANGARLSTTREGIGVNGEKLILSFDVSEVAGFYGFGERTKRLNKSGDRMDFWNVDVVAVFPHTYTRDDYDPAYASIPLAILKTGANYTGLFFDNPERAVIDVEQAQPGQMIYQSMGGNTELYVLAGPTLRDVVRHFAALTGKAEVPPLWSIGYHQCRWGYETEADFVALKQDFAKFGIPVSAFWYDIDYMDGYRVFTWDEVDFPAPGAFNAGLKESGIRTVTIIDPGVKLEPGYSIYDEGKAREVFCKTQSGRDYVGRVWPGDTVFPDFTLEHTRAWWAEAMAKYIRDSAIDGVWLDMNDPATGYSAAEDMLFDGGRVPHAKYHNQYAHFMARAGVEAFDRLDRNARPFQLTRSACAGTQRYAALWTGDNASSWGHLRMSIPCTLNLGLSGFAFNGPDVGGFMGHTTAELLVRWYQAGFLFPFFRNHSMLDSKPQEPWEFGPRTLQAIRAAIRTRYRLLPLLYTCFFQHYLTGDPVLRPLLYEYEGAAFENLDDQFLLGDSLLAAPIVHGDGQGREIVIRGARRQLRYVTLPPGWWFDLNRGEWIEGGRTFEYAAALEETPLFARDGAVIPWYEGPLHNDPGELDQIELHLFLKERPGRFFYFVDDRRSRDYREGRYNTALITADSGYRAIRVNVMESGQYPTGTVGFRPVLYGRSGEWQAVVVTNGESRQSTLQPATRDWLCKSLPVLA